MGISSQKYLKIKTRGVKLCSTKDRPFLWSRRYRRKNSHIKEGIVVRSREAKLSDTLQKDLSFKVINDEFWSQED